MVAEKDLGGYWPTTRRSRRPATTSSSTGPAAPAPAAPRTSTSTAAPSPSSGRSPTGASTATCARTPRAMTSTCSPARTCRAGASTPVRRRSAAGRQLRVRREPRLVPEPRSRRLGLRQHLRRPELQLPGSDQLVAVKLDGSGKVEAFGNSHNPPARRTTRPRARRPEQGRPGRSCSPPPGSSTGTVQTYIASMNPDRPRLQARNHGSPRGRPFCRSISGCG